MSDTLLRVEDLKIYYPVAGSGFGKKEFVKAVDGVTFEVKKGEVFGIVGESGCGKSTLGRGVCKLENLTSGHVYLDGEDITEYNDRRMRSIRKKVQMVFQDPYSALNPQKTIYTSFEEPLKTHGYTSVEEREAIMQRVLKLVNIPTDYLMRYPHEFSGGQCQRIGIARALIIEPKMIICDEPVSALDVSIQAQVVNLLKSLQKEMGLSLIFIAHDLAVVKHISDRVLVMYLGNAMELGSDEEVYNNTKHPYTKALMSAVPIPDPKLERNKSIELLEGELPSPINPPSGCVFRTRCLKADENCAKQKPPFTSQNNSHFVACLKVL